MERPPSRSCPNKVSHTNPLWHDYFFPAGWADHNVPSFCFRGEVILNREHRGSHKFCMSKVWNTSVSQTVWRLVKCIQMWSLTAKSVFAKMWAPQETGLESHILAIPVASLGSSRLKACPGHLRKRSQVAPGRFVLYRWLLVLLIPCVCVTSE